MVALAIVIPEWFCYAVIAGVIGGLVTFGLWLAFVFWSSRD